jgi:hypothetical protein
LAEHDDPPNPRFVRARYADDGTPCVVEVSSSPGRPLVRSYRVCGRPVFYFSPEFCEDAGRLICADEPGRFA